MKKKVCFFLFFVLLGLALFSMFFEKSSSRCEPNSACAFCDHAILNRQKFYEDEHVCALYTHKPMLPGHCLIIPKRHVYRFETLTQEEISHLGMLIKKVNQASMEVFGTSSYLLLQKNGYESGQTVPHVHFHYIPRKEGDDSRLAFIFKMFMASAKKPISHQEMEKTVEMLKHATGCLE